MRVTVGMPLHGDVSGLRRALPTVAGPQHIDATQIIVVDESPSRESSRALAELAECYENISVVRPPPSVTRGSVLNEIADLAGEGYLGWIDPDWMWLPQKQEAQLTSLQAAGRELPGRALLSTGAWEEIALNQRRVTRSPPLEVDQFTAALTGVLSPELPVMFGPAQHFRDVGFDPALPGLHHVDFLLRFLRDGGRLIDAECETPLATKLLGSYRTGDVKAASELIGERFSQQIRELSSRDRRTARAWRYQLTAEAIEHAAGGLRGSAYRGLAVLVDPRTAGAARTMVGGVRLRAIRSSATRQTRRVLAAATPAMRKLGIVGIARRLGVSRRLRMKLATPEPSHIAQSDSAIVCVEKAHELVDTDSVVDPQTSLRVEQACREAGLLHSAEQVLRRSLSDHPGHPELRVRLLELLALRKKHHEVLDLWAHRTSDEVQLFQPVTYARVARVLRDVDDNAGAMEVAEEGTARWPDDSLVRDELFISRSVCADWQSKLVVDPPTETSGELAGIVETMGFLAGDPKPLTGTVCGPVDSSTEISLLVNGVTVAVTKPLPQGEGAGFSLRCDEVLQYLGDGDVVAVAVGDGVLNYGAAPASWRVRTGYSSRSRLLHERIAHGYVFTKFGTMKQAHSVESKKVALDLFDEVAAVLRDEFGHAAYPFYGNLLGAIREHDFIRHDVGGFDMTYLSAHLDADAVRAEFRNICSSLVKRGYFVRMQPWSAHVRRTYRSRIHVDLNYAWFVDDDLHVSGGTRFRRARGRERFTRERMSIIADREVLVPGNAEDVLIQLYGEMWDVPDQGFDINDDLKLDQEFLLQPTDMAVLQRLDLDRVQIQYIT